MEDRNVEFERVAKVPLEDFFPELQFEFPDLDSEAIPHFLMRAITKFARESNALRRTATVCTYDCIENYLLEPPDCVDIVAVMRVCKRGCACGPVTRVTHEPCQLQCGTYTWFEQPNTIYFSPGKTGTAYKVWMSVAPKLDACEVDSILLTQYLDVILDGAKSYIYALANKPWSNVQRAAEARARFERGIPKAAIDTLLGGQRGVIKIRTHRGFL